MGAGSEAYAAFHPSRGWVLADHDARRRYRLDLEWLLRLIARDLGLPADGRVVSLESGLLWDLGEIWAGRRRAAVLYARRLGHPDELDRVCGGLKHRVGRRPGVVLTTCLGVSPHIHVPGYRIVSLRECAGRTRGTVVDPDMIADALDAQGSPEPGPVRASVDFSTITVGDRMFYFRGSKQRQVVQYLYEQWQAGQPRVSASRDVGRSRIPGQQPAAGPVQGAPGLAGPHCLRTGALLAEDLTRARHHQRSFSPLVDCGPSGVSGRRPTTCPHRSTAGLPRASTQPTSREHRHCSTS